MIYLAILASLILSLTVLLVMFVVGSKGIKFAILWSPWVLFFVILTAFTFVFI